MEGCSTVQIQQVDAAVFLDENVDRICIVVYGSCMQRRGVHRTTCARISPARWYCPPNFHLEVVGDHLQRPVSVAAPAAVDFRRGSQERLDDCDVVEMGGHVKWY